MIANSKKDAIIKDILGSKKYKCLNTSTIEHVVEEVSARYPEKLVEDKTRDTLHQIWGAFWPTRPDFKKLYSKIESTFSQKMTKEEILLPILKLHSSTEERIPILDDFYARIFEVTGVPTSIVDYACGLNPLTYPWMKLPFHSDYLAYDIDLEEVDFINKLAKLLDFPEVKAFAGDISDNKFPATDVAFMFKLLPLFQHQKKNFFEDIFPKINSKNIVVSFPIRSIGGKDKNMLDFYTKQFETESSKMGIEFVKLVFPSELVFIIKKYE